MNKVLWAVALVCVVAFAYVLGTTRRDSEPTKDPDTVPTFTDDPAKSQPKEPVPVQPLPPATAPPSVPDPDLVRQTLKPGKTYKTLLKGVIDTRGTDHAWGVRTVVNIHYVFEAEVDREIVQNDGEVVIEHRHFRNVRSVKIDTDLEDFRIELGSARLPVLAGLASLYPPAAVLVRALDGVSLAPVLELLKPLGVDPVKVTGQDRKVFKVFTQFDTLTGKSVKLVYSNKPGETGVNQFEGIVGEVTESETFLHRHSAVLSDALLFPRQQCPAGESWTVKGAAFGNLIDPGLRAAVAGEVVVRRAGDAALDGKPAAELVVEAGRLDLVSDRPGEGNVGWFEPRGKLLFSKADQYVIQGELAGRGQLEKVSRGLLFKSELRQEPKVTVKYSCRMVDTPKGGGKP